MPESFGPESGPTQSWLRSKSENALPSVGDDLEPSGWDDPLKGIEKAILSRIDYVENSILKSMAGIVLSIQRDLSYCKAKFEHNIF